MKRKILILSYIVIFLLMISCVFDIVSAETNTEPEEARYDIIVLSKYDHYYKAEITFDNGYTYTYVDSYDVWRNDTLITPNVKECLSELGEYDNFDLTGLEDGYLIHLFRNGYREEWYCNYDGVHELLCKEKE